MNRRSNQILVLKFGGTSMQTVPIIKHVAQLIRQKRALYDHTIVVVSAMASRTNELCAWVQDCQESEHEGFLLDYNINADSVIASGEQVTAGLLAICLQQLSIPSIALASWQIPIITNHKWGNASIENINTDKLNSLFAKGVVPIVTGFQGCANIPDLELSITTTLGRGGSDTTATALACALKADKCEIFTDVPGIFTADPNLVPKAKVIEYIDYDFLEVLTQAGAKVVHPQAAKLASEHKIDLRVCSTFDPEDKGTQVVEKATLQVCFVHRHIIRLQCQNNPLENSHVSCLHYEYNPSNQTFLGFFDSDQYKLISFQKAIFNFSSSKAYLIQILNGQDAFKNVNIRATLVSANIEFLALFETDLGKSIIVDEKNLSKTAIFLHELVYGS